MNRVGNGYDIHRTQSGLTLVLGGLPLPASFGLVGHSDADVLTHAIIDAILGASAEKDIGRWFPDDDPQFKDANSLDLLKHIISKLSQRNLKIHNIDSTVICERPRLAHFIDYIRENLATALEIPIDCVSIKAKSNERIGEIGAGKAIAAIATVLIDID